MSKFYRIKSISEVYQNFDKHSQDLIIYKLETVLKYRNRYFDRQFFTRSNSNKDVASKFEEFLNNYFASNELSAEGIPTIKQCGESLNIWGVCLSDLLKVETGKSALNHIHMHLMEKVKKALLGSYATISQVAFELGFYYPQHFSKIFKSKTGISPSDYRNLN